MNDVQKQVTSEPQLIIVILTNALSIKCTKDLDKCQGLLRVFRVVSFFHSSFLTRCVRQTHFNCPLNSSVEWWIGVSLLIGITLICFSFIFGSNFQRSYLSIKGLSL